MSLSTPWDCTKPKHHENPLNKLQSSEYPQFFSLIFVTEPSGYSKRLFWLSIFLIFLIVSPGCSKKVTPLSTQQVVSALTRATSFVRTVNGGAWITAKSPEGKISFPSTILVHRGDPKKPKLRVEAVDPLGATHATLVLNFDRYRSGLLTWVDYDHRKIYRFVGDWYGLPLRRIPEILLGLHYEDGIDTKITGVSDQTAYFEVGQTSSDLSASYAGNFRFEWEDSENLVLVFAKVKNTFGYFYEVDYSRFRDEKSVFLPTSVEAKGFKPQADSNQAPVVEISVSWRNREFNEQIPAAAFEVPKVRF